VLAVSDVTHILTAVEQGDPQAADKLLALVYEELRKLMRRILIDRARHKRALRHGGGQQRVDLDHVDLASATDDYQLLAVNDALDKLATQSKMEAELVKLRYFVGMTLEEAADALGISARTAGNYWAHARAWLCRELKSRKN
jgi:RNA polymerase sigma factor (TIGR02999 family)